MIESALPNGDPLHWNGGRAALREMARLLATTSEIPGVAAPRERA